MAINYPSEPEVFVADARSMDRSNACCSAPDDEAVPEPPAGSAKDGVSPDILRLRVPEERSIKNRLHLDLRPHDQAEEVARAEALGAKRVSVGQGGDVSWIVMADPEDNEFCILQPLTEADVVG